MPSATVKAVDSAAPENAKKAAEAARAAVCGRAGVTVAHEVRNERARDDDAPPYSLEFVVVVCHTQSQPPLIDRVPARNQPAPN